MKMENDLGRDDIRLLVMRIAFPSMLAQFVSVLYSVVDRMYIGNIPTIGETALAGVGLRTHCDADHSLWLSGGNRRGAPYEYPSGREG